MFPQTLRALVLALFIGFRTCLASSVVPCQTCSSPSFSFDFKNTFDGDYTLQGAITDNSTYNYDVIYQGDLGGDVYGYVYFLGQVGSRRRMEEVEMDDHLRRVARSSVESYKKAHPDMVKRDFVGSEDVVWGGGFDLAGKLETAQKLAANAGERRDRRLQRRRKSFHAFRQLSSCDVTLDGSSWLFFLYDAAVDELGSYPAAVHVLTTGVSSDISSTVGDSWYFLTSEQNYAYAQFSIGNCDISSNPTTAPTTISSGSGALSEAPSGAPSAAPSAAPSSAPTAAPTAFTIV